MSRVRVFVIAALYTGVVACGAVTSDDPASSADQGSWTTEPPAAAPGAAASDDTVAGATAAGTSQATSCSIVQFCNAPGSDGTRCLQQGCSLTAALDECEVESRRVCGTPVCPWVFVALDGTRFFHVPCP